MACEGNCKSFVIGDILSESWKLLWQNFSKLLPIMIVASLAYLTIIGLSAWFIEPMGWVGSLLYNVIAIVAYSILTIGGINIALRIIDRKDFSFRDFFSRTDLIWPFILFLICFGVAVMVGFVLLIIPGIIMTIRFNLGSYVLVDQSTGPIVSLQKSWDIVKGCSWKMLGFIFAMFFINLLGALVFLVGLFVTGPLTILATGLLYRQLNKKTYGEKEANPQEVTIEIDKVEKL